MFNRRKLLFGFSIVAIYLAFSLFHSNFTTASTMFNRSVDISTAEPSAVSTENFQFDIPTTSVIGSIVLQYCSNTPYFGGACTPPGGLDVSSAVLTGQSGNAGFRIDAADTTPNQLVLTRAALPGIVTSNSYGFSSITNPSADGTVYVRISTHAATDGSGADEDTGAVAFAIQGIYEVDAFVPPFLQLCVAITVAPDCSTMSGDSIDLGILSSTRANDGQSQFATATNDPGGYTIFALGNTMTSGNNIIPSLSNPSPSFPGTGQFGINLRANLLPAIGQDPVGTGTAAPSANYDVPNRFLFNSGDSIASSSLNTNYNRMTVSYLVNVPPGQAPGVYATTLTYVATVQF